MKKFLFLLGFLLCAGIGGFLYVQQSVEFSMVQLHQALQNGDVEKAEKYADLNGIIDAAKDFAEVFAKTEAESFVGKGFIADLTGQLVGSIAEIGIELTKEKAIQELRSRIKNKKSLLDFGPFELAYGYDAIRKIEAQKQAANVYVAGKCYGEMVAVQLVFERVPGVLGIDFLGHWRVKGFDKGSLAILAADCRAGYAKRAKEEKRERMLDIKEERRLQKGTKTKKKNMNLMKELREKGFVDL